jgi:ribulose kinase
MLAGVATGAFADLEEACAAMVTPRSRYLPDPEAQAIYEIGYRRYRELFDALRPAFAGFGPDGA